MSLLLINWWSIRLNTDLPARNFFLYDLSRTKLSAYSASNYNQILRVHTIRPNWQVDTQIFHLLFPTLVSVVLTPASEVTVEDLSDVKAIFSCLSSHLLVTKHK